MPTVTQEHGVLCSGMVTQPLLCTHANGHPGAQCPVSGMVTQPLLCTHANGHPGARRPVLRDGHSTTAVHTRQRSPRNTASCAQGWSLNHCCAHTPTVTQEHGVLCQGWSLNHCCAHTPTVTQEHGVLCQGWSLNHCCPHTPTVTQEHGVLCSGMVTQGSLLSTHAYGHPGARRPVFRDGHSRLTVVHTRQRSPRSTASCVQGWSLKAHCCPHSPTVTQEHGVLCQGWSLNHCCPHTPTVTQEHGVLCSGMVTQPLLCTHANGHPGARRPVSGMVTQPLLCTHANGHPGARRPVLRDGHSTTAVHTRQRSPRSTASCVRDGHSTTAVHTRQRSPRSTASCVQGWSLKAHCAHTPTVTQEHGVLSRLTRTERLPPSRSTVASSRPRIAGPGVRGPSSPLSAAAGREPGRVRRQPGAARAAGQQARIAWALDPRSIRGRGRLVREPETRPAGGCSGVARPGTTADGRRRGRLPSVKRSESVLEADPEWPE
nr:uncharacterized protein LOC109729515 [Microcebus murinus]